MTRAITFSTVKPSVVFPRRDRRAPREAHWLGRGKGSIPQENNFGGDNSSGRRNPQISAIDFDEVEEVINVFSAHLLASPYEFWIQKNYFCLLGLVPENDDRPPFIFGRVQNCLPSADYLQNIERLNLMFPHIGQSPEKLFLKGDEISSDQYNGLPTSYCIRVEILGSPEDLSDFEGTEDSFVENGFMAIPTNDYSGILDLHAIEENDQPWIYVIGSRWFSLAPEPVKPLLESNMRFILARNRIIINYHPEGLDPSIKSLNRVLKFKRGITKKDLFEPEDPDQAVKMIALSYDELFQKPLNTLSG